MRSARCYVQGAMWLRARCYALGSRCEVLGARCYVLGARCEVRGARCEVLCGLVLSAWWWVLGGRCYFGFDCICQFRGRLWSGILETY